MGCYENQKPSVQRHPLSTRHITGRFCILLDGKVVVSDFTLVLCYLASVSINDVEKEVPSIKD